MRSLGTQFCFSDVHLGAECWSYRGRGEGDALIIISDNKPTGLLFSFVCCLEFTTILKMTWSWGYILHTWRYAAGYEETLGVCKDFRENGEIVDGCKWLCTQPWKNSAIFRRRFFPLNTITPATRSLLSRYKKSRKLKVAGISYRAKILRDFAAFSTHDFFLFLRDN